MPKGRTPRNPFTALEGVIKAFSNTDPLRASITVMLSWVAFDTKTLFLPATTAPGLLPATTPSPTGRPV